MKTVWILVFLAVGSVVVLAFHTMRQEINILRIRKLIVLNNEDVKKKEAEIIEFKEAIQTLSSQLEPLDKQKIQMTKDKEDQLKKKESTEQILNNCQTQKKEVAQQKSEKDSGITSLKEVHNAELQKLQEEIKNLEKQILERDTKICAYIDTKFEDGRTLCKDKMPAN